MDAALSTKADVANVYDRTQLYTQIETNNLLNNKQNNLSTLLGDDATTFQILNGTKVKALREGSNIQMSALNGGDEIEIEAVIPPTDLSNYYNRSEADTAIQTAVSTSPGASANFTVSNAELNTTLNINNTGAGYSSLYLNSLGQSSQLYTDSQGLVIGTNTAPGNILLSCNRFTNTQSEL